MLVEIVTLFPETFDAVFNQSLLKKAQAKGLFSLKTINLRDFTTDKHKTADATPYGGGAGMVLKVEPLQQAVCHISSPAKIILMCPSGKILTQAKVNSLAQEQHLVILAGHYEGFDERVRSMVDEEVSIGDYVLTGGEIPAMVLIEAVVRQIPGVVKEKESLEQDSFYAGLLDYPSYTRPENFNGQEVPDVLLSGHHAQIDIWRRKEALRRTLYRRPDLLAKVQLNAQDRQLMGEIITKI